MAPAPEYPHADAPVVLPPFSLIEPLTQSARRQAKVREPLASFQPPET
jgi:hypothetical protein